MALTNFQPVALLGPCPRAWAAIRQLAPGSRSIDDFRSDNPERLFGEETQFTFLLSGDHGSTAWSNAFSRKFRDAHKETYAWAWVAADKMQIKALPWQLPARAAIVRGLIEQTNAIAGPLVRLEVAQREARKRADAAKQELLAKFLAPPRVSIWDLSLRDTADTAAKAGARDEAIYGEGIKAVVRDELDIAAEEMERDAITDEETK